MDLDDVGELIVSNVKTQYCLHSTAQDYDVLRHFITETISNKIISQKK